MLPQARGRGRGGLTPGRLIIVIDAGRGTALPGTSHGERRAAPRYTVCIVSTEKEAEMAGLIVMEPPGATKERNFRREMA